MDLHKEIGDLITKYVATVDTDYEAQLKGASLIITEALLLASSFAIGANIPAPALAGVLLEVYEIQAGELGKLEGNSVSTKTVQ